MKKFILALLTVNLFGCAGAQSQDEAMGALIGGTLGYVFGDGSGHQKEIAAGAAVAGALLGGAMNDNYNGYRQRYPDYRNYGVRNYCSDRVPPEYAPYYRARDRWIDGCVNRELRNQQEFENRAYQDGYRQ